MDSTDKGQVCSFEELNVAALWFSNRYAFIRCLKIHTSWGPACIPRELSSFGCRECRYSHYFCIFGKEVHHHTNETASINTLVDKSRCCSRQTLIFFIRHRSQALETLLRLLSLPFIYRSASKSVDSGVDGMLCRRDAAMPLGGSGCSPVVIVETMLRQIGVRLQNLNNSSVFGD